jgi:hypothetical protein
MSKINKMNYADCKTPEEVAALTARHKSEALIRKDKAAKVIADTHTKNAFLMGKLGSSPK